MIRIAVLGLSLIVVGVEAGCAQDIAGIEDCTKRSGLDKPNRMPSEQRQFSATARDQERARRRTWTGRGCRRDRGPGVLLGLLRARRQLLLIKTP